jgi:hypothetical protein
MKSLFFTLFLFFAVTLASIDFSVPEQYATVLAWDQFEPTLITPSPFFGILFLTVTKRTTNANISRNTFYVNSLLWHNVDYATDVAVYGPDPRGAFNASLRLFSLFPSLGDPTSNGCPIYHTSIVDDEVVRLLRKGQLFAEITAGGADGGQLRGQIETRDDIYVISLLDPDTINQTSTGMGLIRTFELFNSILPTHPVGIDYYFLTSTRFTQTFVGVSNVTGFIAVNFGQVPSNINNINAIFATQLEMFRREDIEKPMPAFGFGSSSLKLYAQDPTINSNETMVFLGDFYHLPFFVMDSQDNVTVFVQ